MLLAKTILFLRSYIRPSCEHDEPQDVSTSAFMFRNQNSLHVYIQPLSTPGNDTKSTSLPLPVVMVIFRSCEALVLRLVEASPPGACPYPIVSDANKHRSHPQFSLRFWNCKLISPLRLCAWFGLEDQKGGLPFYPSQGPRRFFSIAVLLNVIAIRTPETVRYDLT